MSDLKPIMGNDPGLIASFVKAGMVPSATRRIVIDIEYDEIVKIYYECLGDKRILDLKLPEKLLGAMAVHAKDAPS